MYCLQVRVSLLPGQLCLPPPPPQSPHGFPFGKESRCTRHRHGASAIGYAVMGRKRGSVGQLDSVAREESLGWCWCWCWRCCAISTLALLVFPGILCYLRLSPSTIHRVISAYLHQHSTVNMKWPVLCHFEGSHNAFGETQIPPQCPLILLL